MAAPGPTPAEDSTRTEWIDVEDVPFAGKPPTMPAKRAVLIDGIPNRQSWQPETRAWYKTISRLPHAVLWGPGDWSLVLTSLPVVDSAVLGVTSAASELRRREDSLGVTLDARRKLRIRYVPAGGNTQGAKAAAAAKAARDRSDALNKRQTDRRTRALAKSIGGTASP